MASNLSIDSVDSDVFFVEQLSNEPSPQRNNSSNILNSTELSGVHVRAMPTISSVVSSKPDIVTLDDNSNEPTMSHGFGRQLPKIPPRLKDLNMPLNPFNILETRAVVIYTEDGNDENYSPSHQSHLTHPFSLPPMNVSTFNSWETLHTTTDDSTFYSEDEPRRVYWTSPLDENFHSEGKPKRNCLSSSPSPPSPPRKLQSKLEIGMSFPRRGGVSQHACKVCGQVIPPTKDIPGPLTKN